MSKRFNIKKSSTGYFKHKLMLASLAVLIVILFTVINGLISSANRNKYLQSIRVVDSIVTFINNESDSIKKLGLFFGNKSNKQGESISSKLQSINNYLISKMSSLETSSAISGDYQAARMFSELKKAFKIYSNGMNSISKAYSVYESVADDIADLNKLSFKSNLSYSEAIYYKKKANQIKAKLKAANIGEKDIDQALAIMADFYDKNANLVGRALNGDRSGYDNLKEQADNLAHDFTVKWKEVNEKLSQNERTFIERLNRLSTYLYNRARK